MRTLQHIGRTWVGASGRTRAVVAAGTVLACGLALVAGLAPGTAGAARVSPARPAADPRESCQLGNGDKHVIEITFDNVHFFRDNPNVPSDLQLMPSLLQFIENNGTMLSNNHTPLIAHTADDILTTLT